MSPAIRVSRIGRIVSPLRANTGSHWDEQSAASPWMGGSEHAEMSLAFDFFLRVCFVSVTGGAWRKHLALAFGNALGVCMRAISNRLISPIVSTVVVLNAGGDACLRLMSQCARGPGAAVGRAEFRCIVTRFNHFIKKPVGARVCCTDRGYCNVLAKRWSMFSRG